MCVETALHPILVRRWEERRGVNLKQLSNKAAKCASYQLAATTTLVLLLPVLGLVLYAFGRFFPEGALSIGVGVVVWGICSMTVFFFFVRELQAAETAKLHLDEFQKDLRTVTCHAFVGIDEAGYEAIGEKELRRLGQLWKNDGKLTQEGTSMYVSSRSNLEEEMRKIVAAFQKFGFLENVNLATYQE